MVKLELRNGPSNIAIFPMSYFFASLSIIGIAADEFDPSKSIPERFIIQLANAARFAPSSYNDQPWRFIFCDKQATPESYGKSIENNGRVQSRMGEKRPLLIIVSANTKPQKIKSPTAGVFTIQAPLPLVCAIWQHRLD